MFFLNLNKFCQFQLEISGFLDGLHLNPRGLPASEVEGGQATAVFDWSSHENVWSARMGFSQQNEYDPTVEKGETLTNTMVTCLKVQMNRSMEVVLRQQKYVSKKTLNISWGMENTLQNLIPYDLYGTKI